MKSEKKMKEIVSEMILRISPSQEELGFLKARTKEVIKILENRIKKLRIKADVFVGGSYAKNTLIKRDRYDIDIFVRFASKKKKENEKISEMLAKIVSKLGNIERVHGSRDYFKLKEKNILFEIIPVLKIKKPSEAENITDLSYFHVNYITKELRKNKKLSDEIKTAKAFSHSQEVYGAESYINGFSGYALELLVVHYKSFLNFIKAIANSKINNKDEKIIIDDCRFYKNKNDILMNMNESKINGPIIVIDPTFRDRNALSALSYETFFRFKKACIDFLKNPFSKFFENEDKEEIFKKKNKEYFSLILKTDKQAGDIAGTKLKKFYAYFVNEASRFFDVKNNLFIYDDNLNIGKIFISAKSKKEIVFSGPPVEMSEPLRRFKLEHKKIKIIKGKAFAYEKNIGFKDWLDDFRLKNEKVIESMDVCSLEFQK